MITKISKMKSLHYLDTLERIFYRIKCGHTGNANEFAQNLGMSRRQLFYYLEELRLFGVPIKFNRSVNSFYLTRGCKFKINITLELI